MSLPPDHRPAMRRQRTRHSFKAQSSKYQKLQVQDEQLELTVRINPVVEVQDASKIHKMRGRIAGIACQGSFA
jgi:hypothetical protein